MLNTISRKELIDSLAKELDFSEIIADSALNHLVNQIVESLAAYKEITLTGFGAPITIRQKPRSLSNPDQNVIEPASPEHRLSRVLSKSKPAHEKRKLIRRNFILDIEIFDSINRDVIGE